MDSINIADNLRELLKIHDMTQRELADKLGTTQQTVSRWLNGINEPDFAMISKICSILGETPNSLLGFDE